MENQTTQTDQIDKTNQIDKISQIKRIIPKITSKKQIIIGIGVFAAIALIAATTFVSGISFTGLFSKAFDKTLAPGEQYERNITVRKYYNVSVRFQKGNSTSYLAFNDNESVIVLEDSQGKEIARLSGVKSGKAYVKLTNYELESIAAASAYNISEYADVVKQPVNDSVLSLSGAEAYVTVKVHYTSAAIAGYVVDDLTGETLGNVTVAAFENDANPDMATAIKQNVSDDAGRYAFTFDLSDSKALDVYVEGYDVA